MVTFNSKSMNIDPAITQKYPKEQIDKAVEILTYKHVSPMVKQESTTEPIMYVFRHGQSEDNINFIFSGWRNSPLTETGRQQALILAEKLKDKKLDMLIASDLSRAIETMKIAVSLNSKSKDMEIHQDIRVRERSYGDLQGTSKLVMYLEDPKKLEFYRRSYSGKAVNGESIEDTVKRVINFCDEIVPLMKLHRLNVAVSCSSNSMRGFRMYFEKLTAEEVCELETPLGQDYLSYIIK